MKILMLTSYVTLKGHSEFMRNQTGFGYMVMDIAKAVGKMEEVDVLATDSRGNGFNYEGVRFLKRSMIAYLCVFFNCLPLGTLLSLRKNYSMSNGSFIRLAYYWMMTGYLHKLLKKEKYDVVHIHGCSFATELWMEVCKQCRQKYVVTLHGLNSFSETVKLEPAGKQYERDFLKRVTEGEFPITVISTGMKRLIEKSYGVCDSKNIVVVCNSFGFGHTNGVEFAGRSRNIREKYNIPQEAKILLYVGNISENKNQRQMVEAYCLLPEEMRDNIWVLFCGRPSMDGSFEDYVRNKSYSDHLVLCGIVERFEMVQYYKEANGVVLLSVAEGFGLSLIEGMHYGVPCTMFSDMDAIEDIFDDRAVVAIDERNNSSVINALVLLLENKWDKSEIISYSKKFESATMAANYVNTYRKVLGV